MHKQINIQSQLNSSNMLLNCIREGFHSRDLMVVVGFSGSLYKPTTPEHRVLSSEDAGHRDWRNIRKNNLQNMAKELEKPTTTNMYSFLYENFNNNFPFLC